MPWPDPGPRPRCLRRAGRRRRRPPEAVGVVAAHPARGHVRRGPEGGGRGGRVVGEAGRLLVPLLGLTREVAREGQVRKGQGQVARLDAVLGSLGCPAQGGPELIGHRIEPGPPATGGARRVLGKLGGGGQAPAQVVSPCRGELTGLGELLGPVLADRLQRPVPGARAAAATASRLWSASRASPSTTSPGSRGGNPATRAAAEAVNGDTKIETRRSRVRSGRLSRAWLQSSMARTERCRSSARCPPTRSRRWSDRPATSPSSPSAGRRAAASSIANATPSSFRQTSATRPRCSGSRVQPTAAARSTNSATASDEPTSLSLSCPSRDSGGTE